MKIHLDIIYNKSNEHPKVTKINSLKYTVTQEERNRIIANIKFKNRRNTIYQNPQHL